MNRFASIVVLACACGGTTTRAAVEPMPEPPACMPATLSLQIDLLLHEGLADAKGLGPLDETFDISPRRLVVIADNAKVYLLGWGGLAAVDGIGGLGSFAYTPDGLLLAVRGAELLYLGASGKLEMLFELPGDGMAIAAGGSGTMYLYDRKSIDARYGVYELTPGRNVRKLFESPQPIDSIASAGPRMFVVSGGAVFEATPGARMRMVASLPGKSKIRSVAADESGTVYFSDGAAVFSLRDGCVGVVTRALGGTLKVRDGALLVLDAKRRTLVRLHAEEGDIALHPDDGAVATTPLASPPPSAETPRVLGARRRVAIGVAVGGLALLGVGVGFAVSANGTYDDAHVSHCDPRTICDDVGFAQVEDAHAAARISTITTVAGVGLVGVGAVLWLTGKHSPAWRTAIVPVMHPENVGLAVGGRF